MIEAWTLRGGGVERSEGSSSVHRPAADERVWYRVEAPTDTERKALDAELPLHELALEDALTEGHPPKIEDFGDHLFFIVHTPEAGDEGDTRKLAVFLGKNWIVSIVRAPLACVESVAKRVERDAKRLLGDVERVAHALVDRTVDSFEAQVDVILDQAETLEDRAFEEAEAETLSDILDARQQVSSLIRVVRGQRDVCQSLSRTPHPVLSKRIQPYLRDVYDHCLRVYDLLESAREAIGAARDVFLSAQSNRLNQTMRVLTVIATVMMPLGVLSGIFGMNFDAIPGLHSPQGFWITMAGMFAVALGMVVWFRRRGWLG